MPLTPTQKLKEAWSLLKSAFYRDVRHESGILITGSKIFREKVLSALNFLKLGPEENYVIVKTYIGWIWETSATLLNPDEDPPVFRIGDNWKIEPEEARDAASKFAIEKLRNAGVSQEILGML